MEINRADPSDAKVLTEIAFAAKRNWGYTEELINLWSDDLTVTENYLALNRVYSASSDGKLIGFCALKEQESFWEIEHLWVLPEYQRRGIGHALIQHTLENLLLDRSTRVRVVSDPNAEGFYLNWGFRRIGEYPSRPSDRKLPLLELIIY